VVRRPDSEIVTKMIISTAPKKHQERIGVVKTQRQEFRKGKNSAGSSTRLPGTLGWFVLKGGGKWAVSKHQRLVGGQFRVNQKGGRKRA